MSDTVDKQAKLVQPKKISKDSKVYFHGLNSLRFLAAFIVIVNHVEQIKSLYGYKNFFDNVLVHNIGTYAVVFFFALSGFLITYLLLVEQQKTGTINIRNFYIRRTLRILPLYYLLGLLSLFILPHIEALHIPMWQSDLENNFSIHVLLYLTFLPNISPVFFGTIPHANQVWSVGVEQQFYLVWPILVRHSNNLKSVIFKVLIGYLLIRFVAIFLFNVYEDDLDAYENVARWYNLLNLTSIDCMAIGALVGIWLSEKRQFLQLFYKQFSQYFLYTITIIFLCIGGIQSGVLSYFNQEIFAVLSTLIILNTATNKNSIIKIENPALNYLGKISYGLYMYHALCIAIALYLVRQFTDFSLDNFGGNAIAYLLTVLLTISFSAVSYRWLEKPFILQKHRFSQIASGDTP